MFRDKFDFDIADTPWMKVLSGEICHYKEGLQGLFPLDKDLADLGAESYLGVPMLDREGRVMSSRYSVHFHLSLFEARRISTCSVVASYPK